MNGQWQLVASNIESLIGVSEGELYQCIHMASSGSCNCTYCIPKALAVIRSECEPMMRL